MGFESILPLITETSSTLVLIALFVWMLTRQPRQISEALEIVMEKHTENIQELAAAVVANSKAIEKVADSHQKAIDGLHEDMRRLTQEVHRLTILMAAGLTKEGKAEAVKQLTAASSNGTELHSQG